jgi:hypothetical protein
VWVGQVSRDIGVRFTLRTWNLTTHRIDPEVDEARDYVIEDLLEAERLEAALRRAPAARVSNQGTIAARKLGL